MASDSKNEAEVLETLIAAIEKKEKENEHG